MAKVSKQPKPNSLHQLVQTNFLFRDLEDGFLAEYLKLEDLKVEKLFSNRPIYTAFMPDEYLDALYLIVEEGLVIVRSAPLDRIISISYPKGCFGMRSLPFSHGLATRAFPSLVEAYKTTHIIKIPLENIEKIYENSELFRQRYCKLFELREKFQYHLLNCSSYPPQAVASLLRGLIYQERELGNQPDSHGRYVFDLPVDVIARSCQLNQRTVEQVLKGLQQEKLIEVVKDNDISGDLIQVIDPEALKEVYSATRDKVSWWPLR
ncbi:putative transcriptional regulator, Crp/Fnr family [Gloeothece citriformis PCC 7424]|uniref:Putative transcriptional regulator, Crp/Fnr family n=1 Tax=Gloeothece citriformis (strain PCC 7424) TaxID=65393 RepID=B7KFD3_GLOC7|nr:Crp/Fnr family transcriptional regulator [Gloeothece citriformis]ACK71849.1 putative transcriptional regulator, Crp/Fnr family [Gloeothece citriformis PCC 7424]